MAHLEKRLPSKRFVKHDPEAPNVICRRGREVLVSGVSVVAGVLEKNGAAVSEEHLRRCVSTAVVYLCTNRLADFLNAVEINEAVSPGG